MNDHSRFITFPSFGDTGIGFLSVGSRIAEIPFEIRRVFWIYGTPPEIVRGHHAHRESNEILIAIAGMVSVSIESPDGRKQTELLDDPGRGFYIPHFCWRTMTFSPGAVLMVIASHDYNEKEYIRSYEQFKSEAASR